MAAFSLRGERAWAKTTVIKAPIRLAAGEGTPAEEGRYGGCRDRSWG